MSEVPPLEAIPTGFTVLDRTIRGSQGGCPGFPKGRITQISAPPGSGFSRLALRSVQAAAKAGAKVTLLDYAGAFHTDTMIEGVAYGNPTSIEDAMSLMVPAFHQSGGTVFLYYPDLAVFEGSTDPESPIGNAKGWAHFLPQLKELCSRTNSTLVAFFQRPNVTTSLAWKYFPSLRIDLEPVEGGWDATLLKCMVSDAHGSVCRLEVSP